MSTSHCVVKPYEEADADRWNAYVHQSESGTFFHLAEWRAVLGDHLGHTTYYLYCERDGEIVAVLPLARVKSWLFGDALISTPFLVYGGPIASDEEASKKIIDAAKALAERLGVDYLEFRCRQPTTDWPRKENFVTFRKRISVDSDENLLAIPRKQRAVIRKAIKAGLGAEIDARTDRLHAVLSENKRNLGTPFFSNRYLQCLKDTFRDRCEVMSITKDGNVLSGVMSFRFRDEILPYYGGGGLAARSTGANDFMYWMVMENARTGGCSLFDYGRSRKDTGAYKFKAYWGFEPEQLSYEYYLVNATKLPSVDPSSARYRRVVSAWSRLPLWVARLVGPHLARLLG
ncbi:MAG: FemAB family XrtA/PEP-CTERM system-associated protein [Pseudomonadota bacterium]